MAIGLAVIVSGCAATPGAQSTDQATTLPHRQLALDAEQANNFVVAAQHYRALMEADSKSLDDLLGLSRNLRISGLPGEARNVLRLNGEDHIDNPVFLMEFAKATLMAGNTPEALKILHKTASLIPDDWRVHSLTGIAYDVAEDFRAATRSFDQALALSPNNSDVLNNMGLSLIQQGNIEKATNIFEQALTHDRGNIRIKQNLALAYAIKGDMEEARRLNELSFTPKTVDKNLAFYSRFSKGGEPVEIKNAHKIEGLRP